MFKLKKVLAVTLVLAMVLALSTACGSGGSATTNSAAPAAGGAASGAASTAGDGKEILIGAIYPLTGDVAAIGQNIQKGINFAVDEINGKGGINGSKIRIIYGDSQGDPKVGMSEAERLITQQNVVALLGAYQSGVTDVVAQVAEKYKTPLLTAISTADALTSHGYKYFFRLAPTNMMFLRDMIQYLADIKQKKPEAEVKTIAVCADNTLLGQETLKWAKYWAEKNNIKVIADVLYTKGAADLSSEVLTLKKANPDALVVDNYISDGILLVKTMKEQGYAPKLMIGKATAYIDPSFIKNVGASANGITTASEFSVTSGKGADVNAKFKEKYSVDMNGHSAESYTATWILKTAIEQAASTDRTAIRDSLAKIKIEGSFPNGPKIILPYDTIQFSEMEVDGVKHTNTNIGAKMTILQIQDGEYKTVWPFEIAGSAPVYPAPFK